LKCLHEPCDSGLLCQIIYLLRAILLFPDAQPPEAALRMQKIPTCTFSDFWRFFHENHVDGLVQLLDSNSNSQLSRQQLLGVQLFVVGIFKSMVDRHDFAMQRTVLKYALMKKIAALIVVPEDPKAPIPNIPLILSCIRFFRSCITRNEDFYKKRIVEYNILHSSVELFCRQGNNHNLLNSCFLSLIYEISTNPASSPALLMHIGNCYLPRLEETDAAIFQVFRTEYEKLKNKKTSGEPMDEEEKKESPISSNAPMEEDSPPPKATTEAPESTPSPPQSEDAKMSEVFKKVEKNGGGSTSSKPIKVKKKRKSQSPLGYAQHLAKRQKLFN